MGPDDLRQHVVADLRGFADFAGNGRALGIDIAALPISNASSF
jgi:hypothetical protein